MSVFSNLTSEQLRKAADLKEQISNLEQELAELARGINLADVVDGETVLIRRKKRKISAEGIARIKAAQKARWARVKEAKAA